MALELDLGVIQSNDALTVVFTDAAGETADTGWGVGTNPDYTEIVPVTETDTGYYHLLLDITITDKDNVETEYDTIDLYTYAQEDSGSPFTTSADLTWSFTAEDLVASETAMGVEETRLTDGIWDITYTLREADTETITDVFSASILLDGDVRADTYDALREISRQYDCQINDQIPEIMEALLKMSYLRAINASGSVSEKTNLINMLWTLDKLNSDGSKYNW
jgi:hypothetical protein